MSFFQKSKIDLKKHYIIHFHNDYVPFHQNPNIFIQVFIQVFTGFYKGFFFFMIPKRQNHTPPNLIAAVPCELMVAVFSAFRDVTEYAAKCIKSWFGFVTIKCGKMAACL